MRVYISGICVRRTRARTHLESNHPRSVDHILGASERVLYGCAAKGATRGFVYSHSTITILAAAAAAAVATLYLYVYYTQKTHYFMWRDIYGLEYPLRRRLVRTVGPHTRACARTKKARMCPRARTHRNRVRTLHAHTCIACVPYAYAHKVRARACIIIIIFLGHYNVLARHKLECILLRATTAAGWNWIHTHARTRAREKKRTRTATIHHGRMHKTYTYASLTNIIIIQ